MDDGVVGGTVEVANSLIARLSPQFLVLVVLNVVGIGAVMWHESSVIGAEQLKAMKRMEAVTALLKDCIGEHARKPDQSQN